MDKLKKVLFGDNLPRFIITVFFLALLLTAHFLGQPIGRILSDALIRFGLWGILVLAMVPAIQSGIAPNFGLPIGIIGGLLGVVFSMEWGFKGYTGLLVAIGIGIVAGAIFGWLYGLLLNRVKGSEMVIATYIAFAFVALMCLFWLMLPIKNDSMKFPIGVGIRNTVTMEKTYGNVLNDALSVKYILARPANTTHWVFNQTNDQLDKLFNKDYRIMFHFPTGLILVFLFCCALVYGFTISKTGVGLRAVGDNQRFARASGMNVDRARIIGSTLSMVLGAVGIVIYSQGLGYFSLYNAPETMAFAAIAAILIGGASAQKARISNVIIGTFLFQGLLTIALPVANQLVPVGGISETLRMIIQNGVILFALAQVGGKNA